MCAQTRQDTLYPLPPLRGGTLLRRYKRFFVDIDTERGVITAHNPNTGAMLSLLLEGAPVLYSEASSLSKRKLAYTLEVIKVREEWVVSNTTLANKIFEAFLPRQLYSGGSVVREYKYGDSRIDFLLDGKTLVEVKSVTHFDEGRALFPDAVTERGRKHLLTLAKAKAEGYRAAALYLCFIEREAFAVASGIDPEYDKTLRKVLADGLEVWTLTAVYSASKNAVEFRNLKRLNSL